MFVKAKSKTQMMAGKMVPALLVCLLLMFTHRESLTFNSTYQTLEIPCRKRHNTFNFFGHSVSYLLIHTNPFRPRHRHGVCYIWPTVPAGKFVSLKTHPFKSNVPCKDIDAWLQLDDKVNIEACKRHTTYHFQDKRAKVLMITSSGIIQFSVTIAVKALDHYGRSNLHLIHKTNVSGIVTPHFFDGYTDVAQNMYSFAKLVPPLYHSVMLSFPHFHTHAMPDCIMSLLEMQRYSKWGGLIWRHCGNLQVPPKLVKYHHTLYFGFYTRTETGYTGFRVLFSSHSEDKLTEILNTNKATSIVFNCSVPFYSTFSQHLMCNLETECMQAEDEASCPYWQGNCQSGFLNAGERCYKYVRTRKRMTWYDASSMCLRQGLTLASFPTFTQGEAFRDGLLRYAPPTFKTFIGLRTSDSSLPVIYREVWQWSTGVIAYYVDIDAQRLFKPTCGSFAAMYREKISTTLCGFYEYMHYIFCELGTTQLLQQSSKNSVLPLEVNSTDSPVKSLRYVTCSEGHVVLDFLSCDHASGCNTEPGLKSCVTDSSMQSDSGTKRVEVLMYVCDTQTQTIHYTQVCDHRAQCFDHSDESFCIYKACSEKQCTNKQCVTTAQWCDGMAHCSDGSDEACPQFMTVSTREPRSSTVDFHVVLFDGYGKYKFTPQGEQFRVCPSTHFMCADLELCIPVYLRCNDVYDCADKDDEDDCGSARCPGFYRCRQSSVCVHSDHLCDGVFQCPQQDDELLCQLVCPVYCVCQGLAFVCSQTFYVQAYPDLRYLDSSGSGVFPDRPFRNHYLVRLSLSRCFLRSLPVFNLPNLKFLYLDNNVLTNVHMSAFLKLPNLNVLSLSGNPITKLIPSGSNYLLENVHTLDLSYTRLNYFQSVMLWNFRKLKIINMSHSMLEVISDTGFRPMSHIESLDLRGSELKVYPLNMLQSLSYLRMLFSDVFKLCCKEVLPRKFDIQNCFTAPDEIASCKDLLRSDLFRVFLWVSCCFSLFGNAGSFAAKMYMQRGKRQSSFTIFVAHLNVADFFMGLYLAIIGTADQVYMGTYLWHDEKWKKCVACKAAGLFSLLSCEMSAFIICFITLDRFLVICFPFSQLHLHRTSAQVVCGLSWMIGIALASFPLFPMTSHWQFYSQTDICIPLPITKQNFKGHYYSFGILIVFNFLLFVFIAVGQTFIYVSVRANSMKTEQGNEREITVARRLLTVAMSDFLCWFPIGLLGLLASSGFSIPGEVNVIMAIFALPLNSALNPFLYTFNLLIEKRRKASEQRLLKILQSRYDAKARLSEH